MKRLLIAARGTTAARVARTARRLGITPVGCAVAEDRDATWTRHLDDLMEVPAYDDITALVEAATALGADALHPGTGPNAESAPLARAVQEAGLAWVGAGPDSLGCLADKTVLAALAAHLGVGVPVTSDQLSSAGELAAFSRDRGGPVVLKTVHGGGGRGVVVVPRPEDAEAAWRACAGLGPLLAQALVPGARHVEVQALGDGRGGVVTLGTRECSVQRRAQKVVEEAPAPGLTRAQVDVMESATRTVLGTTALAGAATCEFLLPQGEVIPLLLEVNARLQVEHSVTEEVIGLDLVAAQLALAEGIPMVEAIEVARTAATAHTGLSADAPALTDGAPPAGRPHHRPGGAASMARRAQAARKASRAGQPSAGGAAPVTGHEQDDDAPLRIPTSGHALEVRLYAEDPTTLVPEAGLVRAFELPLSVPAPARARVERAVRAGDAVRRSFSEPLALLTTWAEDRTRAFDAMAGLLDRVEVAGPATLLPLLRRALDHPDLRTVPPRATTRWLETVAVPELAGWPGSVPGGCTSPDAIPPSASAQSPVHPDPTPHAPTAPTQTRTKDTRSSTAPPPARTPATHSHRRSDSVLYSPLPGVVAARHAAPGQEVAQGEVLAVVEAMKMRLPLTAPAAGRVVEASPAVGTAVRSGEVLVRLDPDDDAAQPTIPGSVPDGEAHRHRRPTARQRAEDLADAGSLTEVVDDDAVLTARARLDGRPVALWAQDPTVAAGTIGLDGARRVAALIDEAAAATVPVIALLDSGGARVQEGVDALAGVALLLRSAARARGRTLQVALVLGPAAGGAAYAPALADLVVMVEETSSLFLTGPAVLGRATGERVSAQDLGGADLHSHAAGTVHLTVPDEAGAWRAARELVGFAPLRRQGERALPLVPGGAGAGRVPLDAMTGRVVPPDPAVVYDVRSLLSRLTDRGDLTELRQLWAPSVVTALARVEGVPVGIVATQPAVGAGALTPAASQKVASHVRLCSDLGLPLLTVLDTPGFLPGVQAEADGAVRHGATVVEAYATSVSRLVTLVTRKAYGGAYVALGSAPLSGATALAWPTAHLGVMDALSAVLLTRRRELAAAHGEGGGPRGALVDSFVAEQERTEAPEAAVEAGWLDAVVAPGATRSCLVVELGRGAVAAPMVGIRHPGDGWVECGCGRRHWGLRGAAGVLVWRRAQGTAPSPGAAGGGIEVLLQLRAVWTHQGGTWGLPGGAVAEGEDALAAALRECEEEAGIPATALMPGGRHVQAHPDWSYTTVAARAPSDPAWDRLVPADRESDALEWVALQPVGGTWAAPSDHDLLPALAAVWPDLAPLLPSPRPVDSCAENLDA